MSLACLKFLFSLLISVVGHSVRDVRPLLPLFNECVPFTPVLCGIGALNHPGGLLFFCKAEWQRVRESESSCIWWFSFQMASSVRPSPEVRNPIWVSHVSGKTPSAWAVVCYFCRRISRELDWRQSSCKNSHICWGRWCHKPIPSLPCHHTVPTFETGKQHFCCINSHEVLGYPENLPWRETLVRES